MKKWLYWLLLSGILMIGGPWVAVTWLGDLGMAFCFLLFFAVNPLFSVFAGVYAGGDIKRLWSIPLVISALFLAGVWLFFDLGEPAFVSYGVVYLLIGTSAMLLSSFVKNRRDPDGNQRPS